MRSIVAFVIAICFLDVASAFAQPTNTQVPPITCGPGYVVPEMYNHVDTFLFTNNDYTPYRIGIFYADALFTWHTGVGDTAHFFELNESSYMHRFVTGDTAAWYDGLNDGSPFVINDTLYFANRHGVAQEHTNQVWLFPDNPFNNIRPVQVLTVENEAWIFCKHIGYVGSDQTVEIYRFDGTGFQLYDTNDLLGSATLRFPGPHSPSEYFFTFENVIYYNVYDSANDAHSYEK